jgi:CTP-dependent riboflavin kinase
MIQFSGIVESRSSTGPAADPPGEADVLALNPARRSMILQAIGWTDLFPGTLNLKVEEDSVHRLLLCAPVIRERGSNVMYPPEYAHIPKLRVGYLYFRATIRRGDRVCSVLVRRACNPLLTRLEVFSERKLRDALGVSDGDSVTCVVDE